ncbi:hypothetical protein [Pseudoalteromonas arabiensis]|uniref:hypothetical protein n=1 Tax=Pseudoalteromonas arabiensis TaxID=874454 RepID=UPI000782656F|nr:hypothetical protein [Pseudoalteromonas arabiensis]
MSIIKTTLFLLFAGLSFTSSAQYNEAMCILLKQQMHEYRDNTSNRNYRSAARNFEKNCKNPTPVNNTAALQKLTSEATPTPPKTSITEHSGAIKGATEDVPAQAPVQQAPVEPVQQTQQPAEPELTDSSLSSELNNSEPVQQDNDSQSMPKLPPATESVTEAAPITNTEPQAPAANKNDANQAIEPAKKPAPVIVQTPEPSSSNSLLMPSLLVLLVLLVGGLFILRLRKSKQSDSNAELENTLLQAQAASAKVKAQQALNEDETSSAESQPHYEDEFERAFNDTFNTKTTTSDDEEWSEFARLNAEHDEQSAFLSTEEQATDFAHAHEFNELEISHEEIQNDESIQSDELESSRSSFGFDEYNTSEPEEATPIYDESDNTELGDELGNDEQDSNIKPELDDEPELTSTRSSFGFDEYNTSEPAETTPIYDESNNTELGDELGNNEQDNDIKAERDDEPELTSTRGSFGFDEYNTSEPAETTPIYDESNNTELGDELGNNEQDNEVKPELDDEPEFTSTRSSFGFDEYNTSEPAETAPTYDESDNTELDDELGNNELDNDIKPELYDEPEFTSTRSSFGFDEYKSVDQPLKDDVPEYDLSSLVDDDLSFTGAIDEPEHLPEPATITLTDDDISDDDLAKALQTLEQELQQNTTALADEPKTAPIMTDTNLPDNDDDTLSLDESDMPQGISDEQTKETSSTNPFANLSLDPTWDPNSTEKPQIASKEKQPKSQALIDAENRAKQLKTDD